MINDKLQKNICFLAAILMLSNITACASEEQNGASGQNTVDSIDGQESGEHSSIETLLADTPSHINKVFSENYVVDADVHVPIVQKADVLFAEYKHFDEQTLLSIFYKGKTPDKETSPTSNVVSYKDGSSELIIADEYILYRTKDFGYVKFPTENFTAENEIFSIGRKLGEVYAQEELSFMTREKAFKTAYDIFERLSVDTTDNAEIYAIDFQTMQKQQEERIQQEIDIQEKMGVSPIQDPTDGYQIKTTFTQDDEFYILYFTTAQNKIPITQKSYNILEGERTLSGTTARVSLSKKGIIEFSCAGVYQPKGTAESPDMIISAEEAIQNAYEIQNAIISPDKVTVKTIDFEYIPVAYNENYDEVKLIPAWSLTVVYKQDIPEKDGKEVSEDESTRMVYINAVTGEEIK